MAHRRLSATTSTALLENSTTPREYSSDDESDALDGLFVGPMSTDAEEARRRALLDALAQEAEDKDSPKSSESAVLFRSGSSIDGGSARNEATGMHATK
jgi:hypothetical protein